MMTVASAVLNVAYLSRVLKVLDVVSTVLVARYAVGVVVTEGGKYSVLCRGMWTVTPGQTSSAGCRRAYASLANDVGG